MKLTARITQVDGSILQAEQPITVNVYPCPIFFFGSNPVDLGTVEYTLGDPGFFFGDYVYE